MATQRVMAELEECVEEVVWGSQVFSRRWGLDLRDLIGRTPEWYELCHRSELQHLHSAT